LLKLINQKKPAPAETPAPAPVDFAPTAAVEENKGPFEDFDITQYSMTISIFVVFVAVKSLSALGVIDFD